MSNTGMPAPEDGAVTTSPGRPKGRAETTAAIVAAATELFRAKGPAGVSLREIAQHAGVNYGLVHRHFGSKEAITAAVFRGTSRRGAQALGASADLAGALGAFASRIEEGDFARMLAWALVDGSNPTAFVDDSGAFHRMRELAAGPDGADDPERRIALAAALSMLMGWQVFAPFLTEGLGLDDIDPAAVQRAIAHRVVATGTSTGHPADGGGAP